MTLNTVSQNCSQNQVRCNQLGEITNPAIKASAPSSSYTAKIGNEVIVPRWDGWGINLSWWAARKDSLPLKEAFADLLFTNKPAVDFGAVRNLPGLGLNIVRYELGGASERPANGHSMVKGPNYFHDRVLEGFWLDWNSRDPISSSWDWNADVFQQEVLRMAKERGVNHFTLTSCTPMWWMLTNFNPGGSDNGNTNNLNEWNIDDFVYYLVTVAQKLEQKYGAKIDVIAPFTEPYGDWWNGNTNNQSGCHFDIPMQEKVIAALDAALKEREMSTRIEAPNEMIPKHHLKTWSDLSQQAKDAIGQIGVHGYAGGGSGSRYDTDTLEVNSERELLAQGAGGKKVWTTEYSDPHTTGMKMATAITNDINKMKASGFVLWQPDQELVKWNDQGVPVPQSKLYVMAQYSRHIKEGMRILRSDDSDTVAAYDPTNSKLVLVTSTWGTDRKITWDLSNFNISPNAKVRAWQTQDDGSEKYHALPLLIDNMGSAQSYTLQVPKNSVVTLEIEGVVPKTEPVSSQAPPPGSAQA